MTFGEKLYTARLAMNLSQLELAEKAGVTERSIYNYEQAVTFPRASTLEKLAEALNVTVEYFSDDGVAGSAEETSEDSFIASVKSVFGNKGVREAQAVLAKASALFAGGELDAEAKEVFFNSIMSVYMASKAEARDKFTPKRRKRRAAGNSKATAHGR